MLYSEFSQAVDKKAAKSTLDELQAPNKNFTMALERTDKGIKPSSGNWFNDVISDGH